MPVKGANQVKGRLRQFIAATDKKALQYVNAVASEAGALSKTKAPLEYGALHNSQTIDVRQERADFIAVLSYNTKYAAALNNPTSRRSGVLSSAANTGISPYSTASIGQESRQASFNMITGRSWQRATIVEKASAGLSPRGVGGSWNPRPPLLKDGPAWNPDAEPNFLEYGFESKEAVASQQRLMEIFKV